MSRLIFIDDQGNQSNLYISNFCKLEISVQDGKIINVMKNERQKFVPLKTPRNVEESIKITIDE